MITLQNISKHFQVPTQKQNTLKEALLNFYKRRPHKTLKALDDINLDIKAGECLGIIGQNGSGKSTLLKILARVYQPTTGQIQVSGTVSPLIELGVGFNEELSARDNVILNGIILGLTKPQINSLYPQIIEFAELEEFMNMKLKNFSSGMKMRLAFAIASQIEADIYLYDEVFSVGDLSFQKKCLAQLQHHKQSGKTIIIVTHDISTTEKYCDRLILLHKGQIQKSGPPQEVTDHYKTHTSS